MVRLAVLLSVVAAVFGQQQYEEGGYPPARNELAEPRSRPRDYHPPAPVHYVNIGTELAGDYKFGYDTGKGPLGQSFREETRLPDGSVKGAYGILDAQGRQRIIRYTAGKDGFFAEGDVGPEGAPKDRYPGPAPQPAPVQQAAPQAYRPPPQAAPQPAPAPAAQYRPPPQQYRPPPQQTQQYRAPPQQTQQYRPPPQQTQQYRPQPRQQYRDEGQYDPRLEEENYDNGPVFIDVERLSYNIGTSKQR